MKTVLVIFCCIFVACSAIPLTDPTEEVQASNFDSNGPQPVDEVIAVTEDGENNPSKRVARFISIGVGVPVVQSMLSYIVIHN